MIKHGVIMVTLLILTLSLLGVVSASDDIASSDVDSQLSLNQEYSQIEVSSYEESSGNVESDVSSSAADVQVADDTLESIDSISLDEETEDYVSGLSSPDIVSVSSYGVDSDVGECLIVSDIESDIPLKLDNVVVPPEDIGDDLCDKNYEFSYDLTTAAMELLDFESADEITVIVVVGDEISNVAAENVLNGIIDASNGYVTYDKGNLLKLSSTESDLIDLAFFIKKDESLTMAFYKNGTLTPECSGNGGSVISAGLWKDLQVLCSENVHTSMGIANSLSMGYLKDVENQRQSTGLKFGQDTIQTLLEYGQINNEIELPSSNGDGHMLGVSSDSDDDAFIWSLNVYPDKNAYVSVDSIDDIALANEGDSTSTSRMITVMSYVQSNSKEMAENNLNPDGNVIGQTQSAQALTPNDIKQIGVNASNRALTYFKSHGIDVNKDYRNFYVLTSAGHVKVDGLDTFDAIDGIIEVFGSQIEKNILSIDTPLWKDLVFYFLWVSSADSDDILSYALDYTASTGQLVESSVCKKQGDDIAYELGLYGKHPTPKPPAPKYPTKHHSKIYHGYAVAGTSINHVLSNVTNSTNATNNASVKKSSANKTKEVKPQINKGNPFNILYNLAAICMIFAVFGTSYSKR